MFKTTVKIFNFHFFIDVLYFTTFGNTTKFLVSFSLFMYHVRFNIILCLIWHFRVKTFVRLYFIRRYEFYSDGHLNIINVGEQVHLSSPSHQWDVRRKRVVRRRGDWAHAKFRLVAVHPFCYWSGASSQWISFSVRFINFIQTLTFTQS